MGLLSSLFSGVSGLNSSGNSISIIGDNIANSNTPGFKASRAEFVDVLSGSLGGGGSSGQIGAGSRLSGTAQNFTQGSLETTGVTTDLAIDGGGFFIIQDTNGVFYSRAGLFRLDNQQILVNAIGQAALGFGITPGGIPNGALAPIDLSTVSSTPSATTAIEVNVNVDPLDTALPGGAAGFDHTDPVTTSNFQTGIRVFDSLGNPQSVTLYFRKSAVANQWFYFAGVNRADIDFTQFAGGSDFNGITNNPPTQFFPLQSGTLNFTSAGLLNNEVTTALQIPYDIDGNGVLDDDVLAPVGFDAADVLETPANETVTPEGWHFSGGATAGQTLAFDFGLSIAQGGTGSDRTTQFGGSSASGVNNFVRFMNQNGFSAGSLNSIDIDEDGFVTGLFSNGQTVRLAQVALANFPSVNGLSRVGKNNFIETLASGNPVIGSPNQSGFGAVRSGFLELSNTDLAEEFVRLILAQRAFQANTRTISTTNELLASLVVLGQ